MNTTRKLEMLYQQRIWNKQKMCMTLTVVSHVAVLIANPVNMVNSDHSVLYYTFGLSKNAFPPGRIRNSFSPYYILAKLYSPLYQICFFLSPPQNSLPPTHRKNDRSLKVQMKCFFLFSNLKEQQKSGRLPFTVS